MIKLTKQKEKLSWIKENRKTHLPINHFCKAYDLLTTNKYYTDDHFLNTIFILIQYKKPNGFYLASFCKIYDLLSDL
ncbi:MAG: hypothetical protein OXM55_05790 [Bdellovibrionales bacterium]|nr:hypothetical protein [Bdellovibrionales bacterium]